jgi:hypothetical protein
VNCRVLRSALVEVQIVFQPLQSVCKRLRRPRSVTTPLRASSAVARGSSRPTSAIGGWAATLNAHGSSDVCALRSLAVGMGVGVGVCECGSGSVGVVTWDLC